MKTVTRSGMPIEVRKGSMGSSYCIVRRREAPSDSPISPYRSKWEDRYAFHLNLLQHEKKIERWWYEPVTLRLATGLRYTPDFLTVMEGKLEFHEVKGWSKNRREGIAKLKMAARVCPWATFLLIRFDGCAMLRQAIAP